MKYILLLLTLTTLFFSCKDSEKTITKSVEKEIVEETTKQDLPVKEALFLSMERTPCFGKCPAYKITIFNTGNVTYTGNSNTKKIGKYSKTLTQQQLNEIQKMMKDIKIMEMKDVYDSEVTDLPSTIFFIVNNKKKKKILYRIDAPAELKQFEKLIDFLVLDDELKQFEGNK